MPTINIIPARLKPRAFCEWGIFKSFVRFSILRTIPLLDSIGANNRPLPQKTLGHNNVADEHVFETQAMHWKSTIFARSENLAFPRKRKKCPSPPFGMNDVDHYQNKKQIKRISSTFDWTFFWINCGSSRVLHVWYKATYIYSKPGYSPNF